MEEAVTVSEPCSAVDIVPTLSNLFGLEYDSRLLSGRDVLDQDYDPADAYGNSWATAAGVYESSTRTFTANPGVTVPEGYVSAINDRVSLQYYYAELLVTYDYYAIALGDRAPNAPQLPTPTPAEDMTPEETLEQPDYIEPET